MYKNQHKQIEKLCATSDSKQSTTKIIGKGKGEKKRYSRKKLLTTITYYE